MLVLRFSLGLILLLVLSYLILVCLALLGVAFRLIFADQALDIFLLLITFIYIY